MLLLGKPGIPAALLTLSGSLLSAGHIPPTGPVAMICLAGAAAYQELVIRGETRRGTNSATLKGV
jgi:hypothetical protein